MSFIFRLPPSRPPVVAYDIKLICETSRFEPSTLNANAGFSGTSRIFCSLKAAAQVQQS
jgi:hypothetical protein